MNVSLDFADIVHNTLRKYIPSTSSTITVAQLNSFLDSIANRSSDTGIDDTMLKMFRNVEERKWIIRIMLKELKLGIDNNKILRIFHPDAVEYYSTNNNLRKVCEVLWSPSIKLNEFNTMINLFVPFQPMLAKRCDAKSFTKDFPENKLFFIETKFDGERFQLHMDKGNFKYFSRKGYDFTDSFGASFSSGTLTPKLKGVFHDNVEKIILDGEMMLWNSRKKLFGSKGMNFDVKKLNSTGYIQPCFCVYDVLLFNDEILANKELLERVKLLRKVIQKNIEGVIQTSCYEESVNRRGIMNALNEVMDTEGEGIVVKDPKSFYKFKDRNSGWYKIKMEYFDDAVVDLDLILMGGNYKPKSSELNSFVVGVYSNDGDEVILSCGKVSSGLNFEELDSINKKISNKGKQFSEIIPKNKVKLAFGKNVPDICIEPEDSLIFTVRATELVRSTNSGFKTPYILRFPRILRIRDDKSYKECLSITELLELCQQNKYVIKLNKRHLELEDITTIKRSKKKKKLDVDIESLTKVSKCLSGIKFFVLSEMENYSMDKIEVLIEKYGGTFSLNLDSDVNIVLVGIITSKVKELLKQDNKFDMVKVEWLQRITVREQFLYYKQEEVLSIGISYYNCLADEVDKYGDSYTEVVNEEALKRRLEIMSEMECYSNINDSIIFNPDLPLFNKYISYFDEYEVINDFSSKKISNLFIDKMEFSYRKGIVMDVLTPEVNLIIMHSSNDNRKNVLEEYARNISCKNFQVIDRSKLYEEETL
ncbi:hypothetical protein WA026_004714 [Henosepilachna vigintioctopunctata]|uniref:DNA ligase 4 n=1 Tax=Henosepilachna vigintioctopunctata TaxID=420089 RepID=A0AAW1V8R7_9CUCU